MKFSASLTNDKRWKEWYTENFTVYFGYLSKGDYRLGMSIGNKEGSIDLFVVTFGYLRD